jgi:hypothetical protein
MKMIRNLRSVNEGDTVSLKYPRHGTGNILCRHTGTVLGRGSNKNGRFIRVKREDGTTRVFHEARMVDLTKF